MDLLRHVAARTLPAALDLLPIRMDSREARALLLAIGLQESGFAHRRQVGGPARGFWQFEQGGGVAGVLRHTVTHPLILPVLELLLYPVEAGVCHAALEHNDVLAACFARLLLWTDARALPGPNDEAKGWLIYRDTWRPGKPHPETWPLYYADAWRVTTELDVSDLVS